MSDDTELLYDMLDHLSLIARELRAIRMMLHLSKPVGIGIGADRWKRILEAVQDADAAWSNR